MPNFPLPLDLTAAHALSSIHSQFWKLLNTAARGNEAGWRLPVLATSMQNGCRQRTVVLRNVQTDRASLLFHTDKRSPKVQQIEADPNVSLLFYDHDLAAQLQIEGTANIHQNDDLATMVWEEGTPASLKMYCAPLVPGVVCQTAEFNTPASLQGRIPDRAEILSGQSTFCVIEVVANTIEWLRLSRDGNLRARFFYEAGRLQTAEWMAP
jgi:pyridoxine/pyridoxamine 5'-phosphate oxidase